MNTGSTLHISRVLSADRVAFLVYDISDERLITEISDYAETQLTRRSNSVLTVEQGLNHLVEFWGFLKARGIALGMISDQVIECFRDENFKKVQQSAAHRGQENHAKATVNLKLYRIYDWLVWLQENQRLPVGTIGLRGLVTLLVEAQTATTRVKGRSNRFASRERKYPLVYSIPDANAKHNAPATVVSEKHLSDLIAYFMSHPDRFLSQRNVLFIDIADAAGFRRGSICSLDERQFRQADIDKADGEFLVRPLRQKLGYAKTFAISLSLAYRIRQFIDDYWLPWVAERRIPASTHQHRIFLSAKTGRPVTDRRMTQVVSAGFRALGFDKGTGPHALRSKFTSETADNELADRLELGLDTSNWSIAAAMAPKLGHNDPTQFYRYASSSQSRKARIQRESRAAELKKLKEEVQLLKEETEALKRELGLHRSSSAAQRLL